LDASQTYSDNLAAVLSALLPAMLKSRIPLPQVASEDAIPTKTALVVVASDRGLCGSYNDIILDIADAHLAQGAAGSRPLLITLGARAEKHFRAQGRVPFLALPMPVTRVISYRVVSALSCAFERLLASGTVEAIDLAYAPYRGGIAVRANVARWLPITPSILPKEAASDQAPIVEGDPIRLGLYALEEWTRVQFYRLMVESVATEHASRFFAMDRASENLTELIEELTQLYHSARQHAITMEMLDLVAGSGILKPPSERSLH